MWLASMASLVFVRQFFHDVRWRARIVWGLAALACVGITIYAVHNWPHAVMLYQLSRVTVIAATLSVLFFVVQVTRMERWWKNSLESTVVIKSTLLGALLTLTALSLYGVVLSPWFGLAFLAAIAPVMIWRTEVWQRIHDYGRQTTTGADDE